MNQDKALILEERLSSIEAEQSVLGGLILDNKLADEIFFILKEEDFYLQEHQSIFKSICHIIEKKDPVDLITLSEELEQFDLLNSVGGISYLAEIQQKIPIIQNTLQYAKIVYEYSIKRKILSTIQEISKLCFNSQDKNYLDLLDIAESKILSIAKNSSTLNSGPTNLKTILKNTLDKIEELYDYSEDGITGLSTGFKDLDNLTSGLHNSELIIIAARPSMGKTTFAMNICENVMLSNQKPVLVFSLEMTAEQLMMRSLSSLGKIKQNKIRTGSLEDKEWNNLSKTVNILDQYHDNLYIDDSSELTSLEINSRARRLAKEHNGLSLIIIDYLQLMRFSGEKENRTLEIGEISRSLKSLAKELNIPVIVLSQLNRSLEQRSDKRPVNSDLRDSGAIEQDADLIMFIYRDEIYNQDSEDSGTAEIIIGKQRNGPIGRIKLKFEGEYFKFNNLN